MTGWLEIHRANLTTRADEITFSLIDLKDLWREARKGNVLTSSSGSTFPRRLNATGHLLRGSCFAPHFILPNALIFKTVKGETKWIEAICYR
jgi:hypothetical protein